MTSCRAWMLAGVLAAAAAIQAQTTTGPVVLPDTLATVVIGDIPGLLDKVGALMASSSRDIKPEQLRQQFGTLVGDPELKALPPGSGLALIVPEEGMPYGYLEVTKDKRAEWKKLLQDRGWKSVDEVQEMLIGAENEQALNRARELAPKVREQLLAGSGEPTLAGRVRLARLLEVYDRQIQSSLRKMGEAANSSAVTTETAVQLETGLAFARAYLAVARQVDSVSLTIEPTAEALIFNKYVLFKDAGSDEATVPASQPDAARLLALLPGNGAVRAEINVDPKTAISFTRTILDAFNQEGGLGGSDQEFHAWLNDFARVWNGSMAMVFMPDEKAPISGAYALGVSDEEAMLKLLDDVPNRFKGSSLERFYGIMGMKVQPEFEKNVRQVDGVQVHRTRTNIDFTTRALEQQRQMEPVLDKLVYDTAIVNKVLLYAVEPYKIDDLIKAAKSDRNPDTRPLVSREKLPPDGWLYVDYHLGPALVGSAALHGTDQPGMDRIRRVGEALKDVPPLVLGGYKVGKGHQFILRVPSELFRGALEISREPRSTGR